jgi:hypothetical protein
MTLGQFFHFSAALSRVVLKNIPTEVSSWTHLQTALSDCTSGYLLLFRGRCTLIMSKAKCLVVSYYFLQVLSVVSDMRWLLVLK